MAIAPNVAKKNFENLSVEELEAKYEELKKNYCFETKEDQIAYIIENRLNASLNTNINSVKIALEELLKEKTGKDYSIKPKKFELTLSDIVNYVTKIDPYWTVVLTDFLNQLTDVSDEDKMRFIINLQQDKDSFNEFTREISRGENASDTYKKYKDIAEKYCLEHSRKG